MPVPIFTEGGRLGAEVIGDDGGQVDAIRARPLLGEEDVVVLRGAERPGIILLRAGVPELEKADGDVAAQGVDVARADGLLMHRVEEKAPGGLWRFLPLVAQLLELIEADDVDPVRAVDGVGIEVRVVEEDAAEVVGQDDVGVEMQPPAVVLKATEPGVDGRAFVEVASVLREEIGLDTNRAMLFRDLLGAAVVVAGDDDHGVEVRMVEREGEVEEVVKADADGDGFETEGFEGKFGELHTMLP